MERKAETLALADLVMRFSNTLNVQSVGSVLAILREADLSLPRLVALTYLYKAGPASISQICEHLNLALGTTSHVVDQLVQGDYVERREAEQDRRLKAVSLTAAGQALVERFLDLRRSEAAQRLERLSPELSMRLATVLAEVMVELHAGA